MLDTSRQIEPKGNWDYHSHIEIRQLNRQGILKGTILCVLNFVSGIDMLFDILDICRLLLLESSRLVGTVQTSPYRMAK